MTYINLAVGFGNYVLWIFANCQRGYTWFKNQIVQKSVNICRNYIHISNWGVF